MPIAFLGGGNMAAALISGFIRQGIAADEIWVVEIDDHARTRLNNYGVNTLSSPTPALKQCDTWILAVKPQQLKEALQGCETYLSNSLIISIAAGIRTTQLNEWISPASNHTLRIVRAMPNTPALIGEGISGLFAPHPLSEADERQTSRILEAVGKVVWVSEETQLDAVTALSGSGPAYVFLFLEALIQAGKTLGLSELQARQLAVSTFVGASKLAQNSSESLQSLREQVTSKGGTTAAALAIFEAGDIKTIIHHAVHAAHARSITLAKELGPSDAEQ